MKSFHANLGAGIDGLVVMILRGWYPLPIRPDGVPISDGAGEVAALAQASGAS